MSSFEAARLYFEHAAEHMGLSQNMRTLLLTPERELKVQVAIERDNGKSAHLLAIGYNITVPADR